MSTKVRKTKKASSSVASRTSNRGNSRVSSAKVTTKSTNNSAIPFKRVHVIGVVVYLLLAIAAVVFMKNTSYQLTLGYLVKDTLLSNKTGTPVFGPAAHVVWDIQLRYAVAAIMVLSAIVPLLYLTKLKDRYQQSLNKRVSLWRWLDLGIIFGLIIEVVALLSGLSDIPTLKIIGFMLVITGLLGWLGEKQVSGKKVPAVFSFGLVTGILPWLIIVPYAFATILYGSVVAPWYVYVLYLTTVISVLGLSLNQYRQYLQRGKWQDYAYAEGRFLSISMFGKVMFAVVLILGLLK